MKRLAVAALLAALLAGCGSAAAVKPAPVKFSPDPVFPVGPISETTSHQIAQLDDVASKLAGHRATVNCWSEKDWSRLQAWNSVHHYYKLVDAAGIAHIASRRIELPPYVCEVLAQVLDRSANQPLFTAEAVTILAHESAHAAGIKVESEAECQAIQTDARAARLLGLSKTEAAEVPHIYKGTLYPYDPPRYRTPVCPAGYPGVLVPDTLGSAAELQPLRVTAAAVAQSLPGWKNLEGAVAVGPLSPCSPVESRNIERARFNETLEGPNKESVFVGGARVKTRQAFETALDRFKHVENCEMARENLFYRESNLPGKFSIGRLPDAFTRLSPKIHAYRLLFNAGSLHRHHDEIHIFDSEHLGWTALDFLVPEGTPIAQELGAVRAALRAMR
ncbi:MAG: hypothetical protein QOG85_2586 [Gaiellaceae bacterium]|jgi:hypothetical protein|nr:hypothetical protein [Gaiellaceae bacterium]